MLASLPITDYVSRKDTYRAVSVVKIDSDNMVEFDFVDRRYSHSASTILKRNFARMYVDLGDGSLISLCSAYKHYLDRKNKG